MGGNGSGVISAISIVPGFGEQDGSTFLISSSFGGLRETSEGSEGNGGDGTFFL